MAKLGDVLFLFIAVFIFLMAFLHSSFHQGMGSLFGLISIFGMKLSAAFNIAVIRVSAASSIYV